MSYAIETKGAISKAIAELSRLAHETNGIAESDKIQIIATNAAAELDGLHREVNELRVVELRAQDVLNCFMPTDTWEDGTACYEHAVKDRARDQRLRALTGALNRCGHPNKHADGELIVCDDCGKIDHIGPPSWEAQLITAAIEIMTTEQVGQWEGVRAWQELYSTGSRDITEAARDVLSCFFRCGGWDDGTPGYENAKKEIERDRALATLAAAFENPKDIEVCHCTKPDYGESADGWLCRNCGLPRKDNP